VARKTISGTGDTVRPREEEISAAAAVLVVPSVPVNDRETARLILPESRTPFDHDGSLPATRQLVLTP
jgi:hypothetical protein